MSHYNVLQFLLWLKCNKIHSVLLVSSTYQTACMYIQLQSDSALTICRPFTSFCHKPDMVHSVITSWPHVVVNLHVSCIVNCQWTVCISPTWVTSGLRLTSGFKIDQERYLVSHPTFFESGSGTFWANSYIADSAVLISGTPIRIVACDLSCNMISLQSKTAS